MSRIQNYREWVNKKQDLQGDMSKYLRLAFLYDDIKEGTLFFVLSPYNPYKNFYDSSVKAYREHIFS